MRASLRSIRPGLAGIVAAALLVVPAMASAQAGATRSAETPAQGPRLSGVRFFESGSDLPPSGARRFAESFERARTRYVGTELTFELPAGTGPFDVECAYRTAADSVMGTVELPFEPQPDWTSVVNARILGWADPGNWGVGTYRVTCESQGRTVGEGSFEIASGPPDIPSFNAKFSRLRFFESSDQMPALAQRTYSTSFVGSQTRYINTELQLAHPAPGRAVDLPVACLVLSADGGIHASFTITFSIQAEWENTVGAQGWGTLQPGWWKPGNYRVACTAEGKLLGEATFAIT